MNAESTPATPPKDLLSAFLEHASLPMAMVEGPTHIVRFTNPAFCRLIDKPTDQVVGKSFSEILPDYGACIARLDRVYRTGNSESQTEQEDTDPSSPLALYTMWPVMADEGTVGVGIVIQVLGTAPRDENMLAMNEALMLGSLRHQELAAAADSLNIQLKAEIAERKQREQDALILTDEVAHRVRNNLQIVLDMIAEKIKWIPEPYVHDYEALQARIGAIAELYDLVSLSASGNTIPIDAYLSQIAETMSASLLGDKPGIEIEVKAEALHIDPDRAVPFGLLVNELATNAIKHAFPNGIGRLVLSVKEIGEQMELTVADDGVGMKNKVPAKTSGKHGADYVAIFVRQLGGTMTVSGSEGSGTTIRIRFPLLVGPER